MLNLVLPNRVYLPSVYDALKEFKKHPSKFQIYTVDKMIKAAENDFRDYFADVEKESKGVGLKSGFVAHTVFWLLDDDKYVGTFDLRHSLTPALEQVGGHIAYQIRPSAQRKGYASHGLILCLKQLKAMNVQQALLTCDAENIASSGVIHKAISVFGGYEDQPSKQDFGTERRFWISL